MNCRYVMLLMKRLKDKSEFVSQRSTTLASPPIPIHAVCAKTSKKTDLGSVASHTMTFIANIPRLCCSAIGLNSVTTKVDT